MSKTAVKKLHWRSHVQDSFVPLLGSSGELGIAIGGGADYGEFPFVTSAPGGGLTVGDIILEIGGTPVLGMTLGDIRGVLNSCPHPIRIKTVSPGMASTHNSIEFNLHFSCFFCMLLKHVAHHCTYLNCTISPSGIQVTAIHTNLAYKPNLQPVAFCYWFVVNYSGYVKAISQYEGRRMSK